MKNSFVSVIMPCRNEAAYIKHCIESLIAQDYPKEHLEFLIVDGMSSDTTRQIIQGYQKEYSYIKLLDNPKQHTPAALNIAINNSKGDIIIRLDCHAKYEPDYILKCVQYLQEYNADNVGGTMKTVPARDTLQAKSIAFCLSDGFGVGNSIFRKGTDVAREVDTVFGGCYKKEVFAKIGMFNEKLIRSQDMEFNLRLKRAGGKIVFVPDIVSYYYPKTTFKEFFKHTFYDGKWSILPLKLSGTFLKFRHYVPTLFLLFLILLIGGSFFSPVAKGLLLTVCALYLLLMLWACVNISVREKDIRFLFLMPVAFLIRHVAYGFGGIFGMASLLMP